ncbi:unnamed protein product [Wuchereria bancrofti]|uniref:Uncharacterized protein n=1 Tax=Wuchereria bancrofti TaxID=6293 RepID=A0A3P7FS37_WUCBA|nr:unnamed protein product [Wuchereria bancrofti]
MEKQNDVNGEFTPLLNDLCLKRSITKTVKFTYLDVKAFYASTMKKFTDPIYQQLLVVPEINPYTVTRNVDGSITIDKFNFIRLIFCQKCSHFSDMSHKLKYVVCCFNYFDKGIYLLQYFILTQRLNAIASYCVTINILSHTSSRLIH